MKKKICFLLTLVALFLLMSFKGGNGFTIEVDDSFEVATSSTEVQEVAKRLSMEESEVAAYFKRDAVKFIAVSADAKTQIRIYRFADTFSGDVYDSENLDDVQIAEMATIYGAPDKTADTIESGGRKYARIAEVFEDSGGEYTSTQYVTVAGGRTIILSCYNPGNVTSGEVEKIFATFTVKGIDSYIKSYSVGKTLVIPAIVLVCGIVAVTVIGLIKHIYEK